MERVVDLDCRARRTRASRRLLQRLELPVASEAGGSTWEQPGRVLGGGARRPPSYAADSLHSPWRDEQRCASRALAPRPRARLEERWLSPRRLVAPLRAPRRRPLPGRHRACWAAGWARLDVTPLDTSTVARPRAPRRRRSPFRACSKTLSLTARAQRLARRRASHWCCASPTSTAAPLLPSASPVGGHQAPLRWTTAEPVPNSGGPRARAPRRRLGVGAPIASRTPSRSAPLAALAAAAAARRTLPASASRSWPGHVRADGPETHRES